MLRKTVVRGGQDVTKSIEVFQIATTVDITATGDYQDESQNNWDGLITVIGMRAQPIILDEPQSVDDLSLFDDSFDADTAGFVFQFTTEHFGVFSKHDKNYVVTEEVGVLTDMIDGITLSGTELVVGTNVAAKVVKSYPSDV